MILRPYLLDGYRNQNSIIFARRTCFLEGSTIDVTEHVVRMAGGGKWIAPGDLCAMTLQGVDGRRYFLASFHGDTNGRASLPVLRALNEALTKYYPDHLLICGMDANTHKKHSDMTQVKKVKNIWKNNIKNNTKVLPRPPARMRDGCCQYSQEIR